MKIFTLDEAQALLPVLEALLNRALEYKREADKVEEALHQISQRIHLMGGMKIDVVQVARMRAQMEQHLARVRESVGEINSIGVEVKDIESGLLDFPCRLDDEIVLLCWKTGEPAIEFWHTQEAGFEGRKPVDERFKRRNTQGGRPN
jgi:hypothetical protein